MVVWRGGRGGDLNAAAILLDSSCYVLVMGMGAMMSEAEFCEGLQKLNEKGLVEFIQLLLESGLVPVVVGQEVLDVSQVEFSGIPEQVRSQ